MGRRLRRVVAALFGIACAVGLVLVLPQDPFPNALFEYDQYRVVEGTLVGGPYPMLLTESSKMPVLLVAPGKHGFREGAADQGRRVRLEGARISRDGMMMWEVKPRSLQAIGPGARIPAVDVARVSLQGEIVDSKCYLGVMNPGQGKVHRDCAARCIRGGIPPLLITGDGRRILLMNTSPALAARPGKLLVMEVSQVSAR